MDAIGTREVHGRSVLLVIADDAIRDAFSMLLRSLGYRVRGASAPDAALHALVESTPRLILFDQTRPAPGARAFVGRLRAEPAWAQIPLVVLGDGAECEAREVAAVFPAPVQLDGVLDVVQRYCARGARAHA